MNANDDRWFAFTAYNSQAHYGYGSPAEAEEYCDILNRDRQINVYGATELADAERIEALESGADSSGVTLREEIDADGCLGLDS